MKQRTHTKKTAVDQRLGGHQHHLHRQPKEHRQWTRGLVDISIIYRQLMEHMVQNREQQHRDSLNHLQKQKFAATHSRKRDHNLNYQQSQCLSAADCDNGAYIELSSLNCTGSLPWHFYCEGVKLTANCFCWCVCVYEYVLVCVSVHVLVCVCV